MNLILNYEIVPIGRSADLTDYNIDDLKLETTRFLLTPENENEYYETGAK